MRARNHMKKVSILAIGTELTEGRVQDTNSMFLARTFTEAGYSIHHITACSDSITEIKLSIESLLANSDIVITSGGLGPTSDDLTRDAVAAALHSELEERQEAKEHLLSFYELLGRTPDPTNNRQLFFPKDSYLLPNPNGTALGFFKNTCLEKEDKTLFSLRTNRQKLNFALIRISFKTAKKILGAS